MFHTETSFLKFSPYISTTENYLRGNNIDIKNRTSLLANKSYSLVQYAPKGSKVFCNNLINMILLQRHAKIGEIFNAPSVLWAKILCQVRKIHDIKFK